MQDDEAESLPVFCVSSGVLGANEAFRQYQESTGDVFATRSVERIAPGEFRFDMKTWHLGALLVTAIGSSGQTFERGKRLVASTGLDHILVQLYVEGGYAGQVDREDILVRPGDVCILDLTRTLETLASAFRNITIVVPRAMLEAAVEDIDSLHGMVLPRGTPLSEMLAGHIRTLHAQLPRLTPTEAETAARATVALITGILASQERVRLGRPAPVASPFRMVQRYIDQHLHDPALSPAMLTEALGLSRAALYRLFEPMGGVAEFIRMRRLTGAAVDLANSRGKRVSEIAASWGFANDTSFSRAFRAYFGISPSEARDEARRIWLASGRSESLPTGTEMSRWLRTLRL